MKNEEGWKEHGEWHYRREAWKHRVTVVAVILGAVATAACLYLLTVMVFLL